MKVNNKILFLIFFFCNVIHSFDRSFFYRASSFWDEPRLEYPYLNSFIGQISGGCAKTGKNKFAEKVNIFDIYGPECVNCDGLKFKPCGIFDIFEANFNYYQNFCYGFFWHFHLPVLTVRIFNSNFYDYFYSTENLGNFQINQFNNWLKCCNVSIRSLRERGLSDSTLFLGWTINYEDTECIDFIDFSFKLGVLFPTGKKKNPCLAFSIPFGYNGHWGLPWALDLAVGGYEWFTTGIHFDGVYLFKGKEFRGVPYDCCTGFLRCFKDCIEVKPGTVWRVGTYAKADHICWGFSLLMAFTYEQQNNSSIVDKKCYLCDDEQLKKWDRFIYQLLIEYDFGQEEKIFNPKISFFYNHQIFGKRVFSTNMLGGYYGLDFALKF